MLARLWWKESRVFGPAWLLLLLAAALLQWILLSVNSADVRSGALTTAGLCWAVLYAFASGAAAFSGERESKNLGFLDALPVGRWTLWLGKTSFVLGSTFLLALLLTGLAALGTETRDPREAYNYNDLGRVFGTLLFEALAWSLLWSSMTSNPLLSGVLGVLSLYASAATLERIMARNYLLASNDLVSSEAMWPRLLSALAALAISGPILAWRPSPRASKKPVRETPRPTTAAIRVSSIGRSLSWQIRREGWTTWLLLALAAVVNSAFMAFPNDGMLDIVVAAMLGLVAGVSVFGLASGSGERRFLVQHGINPGTVWLRRFLAWGIVTGCLVGPMSCWALNLAPPYMPSPHYVGRGRPPLEDPLLRCAVLLITSVNAFAVGLLCGMTISRRITAVLVGAIALIALVPIQIVLVAQAMAPIWTLALVPIILIGVSRIWAADWLIEREGARPWLRLMALLAIPFGFLGLAFVTYRALEVPDVGPQFVEASLAVAPFPADQDAASAYRRASEMIRAPAGFFNAENGSTSQPLDSVIESDWNPEQADVVTYWTDNREAIDRARAATALPGGRFEEVGRLPYSTDYWKTIRGLGLVAQLLALDTRQKLAKGDLPGSWDDILAQFRMANQLGSNRPTLTRMTLAARVHLQAVGLAFDWLAVPGLSNEVTRKALADLKVLSPLPNLSATLQSEASIIDRTLDLASDELVETLLPGISPGRPTFFDIFWFTRVVAAPWERQRARRICRLLIARDLPSVALEPSQRPAATARIVPSEEPYFQGLSLTRLILPNFEATLNRLDRELVGRRALEQAIAIEAWKLEHQGEYPKTLDALVPEFLVKLPVDPFSGSPFGYEFSTGQPVRPAILPDPGPLQFQDLRPTRPGQPLLSSIGPSLRGSTGPPPVGPPPGLVNNYRFAVP